MFITLLFMLYNIIFNNIFKHFYTGNIIVSCSLFHLFFTDIFDYILYMVLIISKKISTCV